MAASPGVVAISQEVILGDHIGTDEEETELKSFRSMRTSYWSKRISLNVTEEQVAQSDPWLCLPRDVVLYRVRCSVA